MSKKKRPYTLDQSKPSERELRRAVGDTPATAIGTPVGVGRPSIDSAKVPRWAGAITYEDTWLYMAENVKALRRQINRSQHDVQALAYDLNIFNVLNEAWLLKMEPEQFNALPGWEDVLEGLDYAHEMMLPYRSVYFEVAKRNFHPGARGAYQTADWDDTSSFVGGTRDYRIYAHPYAFVATRLPDGGLWIIPYAQVAIGGGEILLNDRGIPMPTEQFICPTVVLGGRPIEFANEWGAAFRTSDRRGPRSGNIGIGTPRPGEFNFDDPAIADILVEGMHSSTEADLGSILGMEGIVGRVLFSDCFEQQQRVQARNMSSMPGEWEAPANEGAVSRNLLRYARMSVDMSLKALAALSILDAEEVTIVDQVMERRDLRRAEKRGWQIAKMIRIGGGVTKGAKAEPTGNERNYSHRFWVRGHVKHFGRDTRVYQNREDLVTPCTRPVGSKCEGGFCRKVKTPPFIKGPSNKPLVAKSRVWAKPKEEAPV
jgi:hypothetical protein